MRGLSWVIVIGAVAFGVWHLRNSSASAPSAGQIESLLKDYLLSGSSSNCSGTMTVEQLDSVAVGEFSSQMGGWPVYADHVETCRDGGTSTTYDGSKDVERKVVAAFARRTATGGLEVYTPEVFLNAQREMQQTFQKALDGIQTK
jgi:hypothetical protein